MEAEKCCKNCKHWIHDEMTEIFGKCRLAESHDWSSKIRGSMAVAFANDLYSSDANLFTRVKFCCNQFDAPVVKDDLTEASFLLKASEQFKGDPATVCVALTIAKLGITGEDSFNVHLVAQETGTSEQITVEAIGKLKKAGLLPFPQEYEIEGTDDD